VRDKATSSPLRDQPEALLRPATSPPRPRNYMVVMTRHLHHHHQVPYMVQHLGQRAPAERGMGAWAAKKPASRRPTRWFRTTDGDRREGAFQRGFKEAAELAARCACRWRTPTSSPSLQRAKDLNPEAIYVVHPRRRQPRLRQASSTWGSIRRRPASWVRVRSRGEARRSWASGRPALHGLHYDYNHQSRPTGSSSPCTQVAFGRNPDSASAPGTGCILIYESLKRPRQRPTASPGRRSQGHEWEKPPRPISIDPETRDIVQTVYIRR